MLSWRLPISLHADFCVDALEEALDGYGKPEIFNTQGAQFTSEAFTTVLLDAEISISMDGKGRCMDDVVVERLWRSLIYEEVYLHAYETVTDAKAGSVPGSVFTTCRARTRPSAIVRQPGFLLAPPGLWI